MSKDLIRQLKNLKRGEVNPREEWLQSNREVLLAQIKNTVSGETKRSAFDIKATMSIFMPGKGVMNVVRPAFVMLVIGMVVMSGWVTTADAAYNALPGDFLYPAKRAAEKTQVAMAAMTGNASKETKLHVEFAKRRAQEAKKIVAGTDPNKNAMAVQTVVDLKIEITSVNNKLDEMKKDGANTDLQVDAVKEVKQNTEQIRDVLQGVKVDLIASSVTTTIDNLTKEVSEAKDMVKDTGVKAVEVMVAKHLEGNQGVTKEEVKEAIDTTLKDVATEIGESKQSLQGVNIVAEAVKTEMSGLVKTQKDAGQTKEGAAEAKELTDKISEVATQAKEATVKTDAMSVKADKTIKEVGELLSSGDLAGAVDKIKEVSEATKEVDKITDNTLKNVQTVLPIVSVMKDATLSLDSASTTLIVSVTTTATTSDKKPVISVQPLTPVKTTSTIVVPLKAVIETPVVEVKQP